VGVQAILQFVDLSGKAPVRGQHLAQAHKSAHHKNAHLDGALGIENGCRHDGSLLGESMGRVSAPTAAFL
jgi:hypothetical protein